MEEKKLTCICCPMGCQLQVTIRDGGDQPDKNCDNDSAGAWRQPSGGTGKDSFRYSEECSDGLHPTVKRSGCRGSGVHRGCGADRSCRNKNRGNNY